MIAAIEEYAFVAPHWCLTDNPIIVFERVDDIIDAMPWATHSPGKLRLILPFAASL